MLKLRVVTALILVAILVAALLWSVTAFLVLMTVVFAVALAEWLMLARVPVALAAMVSAAAGVLLLVAAFSWPVWAAITPMAVIASTLWAGIALLIVLHSDPVGHPIAPAGTAVLALVLSVAAWLALYHFLMVGPVTLLSVLMIVWIADTAAYFAGRAWGRTKLAPSISPGKTWAGVAGAVIAVLLAAAIGWWLWPGAALFSNRLIAAFGVAAILPLTVLVAVSVVGDLYESMIKRQANVKDSSRLLPGHGGVLDRLDAMIALLPLAALLDAAGR